MKIVIWVLCVFVFSAIQTLLRMNGIMLGGLPTVLLALVTVFLPAPALCRLWGRRGKKKLPPAEEKPEEPMEKWYTCPKCGQLVREGEACDCEAAVPAETPREEPQEQMPEDTAGRKRRRAGPALIVAAVVVACALSVVAGVYFTRSGYEQTIADMEQSISELEQRVHELENPVEEQGEDRPEGKSKLELAIDANREWRSQVESGQTDKSFDEWWEEQQEGGK